MRVAILGCGPAGLFAAQAATKAGVEFQIFSRKMKSHIAGAQYLHKPIPGLSGEETSLIVYRWGDKDTYARKVYGDEWRHVRTSWENFPEQKYSIYSLNEAYNRAWQSFSRRIEDRDIGYDFVNDLVKNFDLVVSSVPIFAIIDPERRGLMRFRSQRVFIVGARPQNLNVMVYNGMHNTNWYRYSGLFGTASFEFADQGAANALVEKHGNGLLLASVEKPFAIDYANPEWLQPEVLKVGRYGRWDKTGLTHEGYYMTLEAIMKGMVE